MKNEQLYTETVDIILDAYNQKRLVHGDACGCFIGNIVKVRGTNLTYEECGQDYEPHWYDFLAAMKFGPRLTCEELFDKGSQQLKDTGYTVEEVILLEDAFENASELEEGYNPESFNTCLPQLEGLKASLKVLAEIHETKADDSLERLDKIYENVYRRKESNCTETA